MFPLPEQVYSCLQPLDMAGQVAFLFGSAGHMDTVLTRDSQDSGFFSGSLLQKVFYRSKELRKEFILEMESFRELMSDCLSPACQVREWGEAGR